MPEEVITVQKESDLWVNDITREMDNYRTDTYERHDFFTYVYDPKRYHPNNKYAIRLPGCTRGSIVVDDDMIITDIYLSDKHCFDFFKDYKPELKEAVKKFIGRKLVIQ